MRALLYGQVDIFKLPALDFIPDESGTHRKVEEVENKAHGPFLSKIYGKRSNVSLTTVKPEAIPDMWRTQIGYSDFNSWVYIQC